MNKELSAEDVKMAFRLILGREVENQGVIENLMRLGTLANLRTSLMNSTEFKCKLQRMMFSGKSKWVAVDVLDQFVQWVDLHDGYVSAGCFNNNWEPDETAYFKSRLSPGDTVLDIGANIGWFTLVAAKQTGKAGRIHSFEPRPETVRMLKRTIAGNDLGEQVTVWDCALSDSKGTVDLVWARNTDNPGHSYIAGKGIEAGGNNDSAKVETARLDDLLPELAPDVIKIDAEGAESLVFRGAANAISRKKPPILGELYPDHLERVSGITAAQYIGQLAQFGYSCFLLEGGAPTKKLEDFPSNSTTQVVGVVFESATPRY